MTGEPSSPTALPILGPAIAVVARAASTVRRGILRDWGPVIGAMWLFQSLKTYIEVV